MDVSGRNLEQTTITGQVRLRLKWTIEMNTSIVRNYLRITKLETCRIGYRHELHRAFLNEFPNIDVTEQRVCDQRRLIMVNDKIPREIINRIRQDVADELNNTEENEEGRQENEKMEDGRQEHMREEEL